MERKNKKVCGYIDANGQFHKTPFEYNQANIIIQINELKNIILNLKERMSRIAYENTYRSVGLDHLPDEDFVSNVLNSFFKTNRYGYNILDEIIAIRQEIDEITDEIERLNKLHNTKKVLRKDWWMNLFMEFESIEKLKLYYNIK